MKLLGRADNGVGTAFTDAAQAADAQILVNEGHLRPHFLVSVRIGMHAQFLGQQLDGALAAGGAERDGRIALGQGGGVLRAADKAALTALGTGQQRLQLVLDGIGGHGQQFGGGSENGAKRHTHHRQTSNIQQHDRGSPNWCSCRKSP